MAEAETYHPRSPFPSITLQITPKDAKRFLEATEALRNAFDKRQARVSIKHEAEVATGNVSSSESANDNGDVNKPPSANKPLHEMLYDAAMDCHHPLLTSFFDKITSSHLPPDEIKLSMLLFHEMDKSAKLRLYFSVLSDELEHPSLSRQGAVSLFRSILTAISCSLPATTPEHSGKSILVEGKPKGEAKCSEPPAKRQRREDETATTKAMSDDDTQDFRAACQSHSFDSSLATLRDEDDKEHFGNLRREIDEVAMFAANELIKFQQHEGVDYIDFALFGEWYNRKGNLVVPWLELLQLSKWAPSSISSKASSKPTESVASSDNAANGETSPSLVSFDFNGSGSPTPLLVNITEDNLHALQHFVYRTGLVYQPPADICKKFLSAAANSARGNQGMLDRESLHRAFDTIIPKNAVGHFTSSDRSMFREFLEELHACFDKRSEPCYPMEVSARELAVGFCFFCSGNKSTKLATGFDIMDVRHSGYLSESQLSHYLEAYLTMLVAISLLVPIEKRKHRKPVSFERRRIMREAVRSGAQWTLGHFLKGAGDDVQRSGFSFETFATWYSQGGYKVAPWLELLDLKKVMSLIEKADSPIDLPCLNPPQTTEQRPRPLDRVSTLRRHHSNRRGPPTEILFTFPLANRRSLVVLKEDAVYVRGVVEQLGLLTVTPDVLWDALSRTVDRRKKALHRHEVTAYTDMRTFVDSMMEVCPNMSRKRLAPGSSASISQASAEEILSNFYQCFDIGQGNRVALDELMGGLTLLCGGKKSTKLAFAFSVFDTTRADGRNKKSRDAGNSLIGEDLFLFLRSILIVTFSCCRQSLDMTDEIVGHCIADTANMICNDVMRHQWESKRLDHIDFDEFGQWYNDGGFERAPWLELLDLKKWVLLESITGPLPPLEKPRALLRPPPPPALLRKSPSPLHEEIDPTIPPPPPEDALDHSFFDENTIMPMDSMDEMDMILMQPSTDKDIDSPHPHISKSFSFSPGQPARPSNSLKFHLVTNDKHGGFMLSMSQIRIRHFRRILEASCLHTVDAEFACSKIMSDAVRGRITAEGFDSAARRIVSSKQSKKLDSSTQHILSDLFADIYSCFDHDGNGRANAIELACGFTVLCRGKKSDKLEFAFEVLDRNKQGQLTRADTASYMRSFLAVLLCVAFLPSLDNDPMEDTAATMKGEPCERSRDTIIAAVTGGAEWAASLAFRNVGTTMKRITRPSSMCFDDFAEWYTTSGYSSIPWLELLDLQKWAFTAESA